MSLQHLFGNLDDLIRTPEDVVQLNNAILDLAVQGKLTSQYSGDEPAEKLLQRILARRSGCVVRPLVPPAEHSDPEEPPNELPSGWTLVRLADVAEVGTGSTPNRGESKYYENGSIPWITSSATGTSFIRFASEYITELALKETNCRVFPIGTLVIALYGQGKTRGQVSELMIEAATNQACAAIVFQGVSEEIQPYVKIFFQKHYDELRSLAEGGAQPNLNIGKIRSTVIPLPPLAEQHRIVAKVDELLAQTRALEANLRRAQEEIVVVNQAALHRLETAEDPEGLHAAWHTISGAFDLLYDDPRPLAALRQTILQLAVRGKLVRQDERDEPGEELLKRIHGKRTEQLGADGLEPNAGAPVTALPYDMPNSWALTRLASLADILGGVTKGRNLSPFATVILPYLRVANVQRGYLDLDDVKDIEVRTEEQAKYALQVGDLLLTEGGDADKLGRTAIWHGQIPNCIHQNHIFRARLLSAELLPEWFMLYLNSGYGQSYFLGSAKQTTNLATINMRQLRSCPIPVPPAAEQRRIVAKVDELLGMCDALERQLDRSAAAQKAAVASVLAHLSQQG